MSLKEFSPNGRSSGNTEVIEYNKYFSNIWYLRQENDIILVTQGIYYREFLLR